MTTENILKAVKEEFEKVNKEHREMKNFFEAVTLQHDEMLSALKIVEKEHQTMNKDIAEIKSLLQKLLPG